MTEPTVNPKPRQTLSYLQQLLEARGLHTNSKLGQNFLIDLNLIDLAVRVAELTREDLVLEVGCGTGSMTTRLAEQAGAVLGVELDPGYVELVRDFTRGQAHVKLIHGDILERKHCINPEVIAALRAGLTHKEIRRLKLVANLPYVVATPVITNLLMSDLPFERMVVTVQWELAERLRARPSTKDFNALSVIVQALADVQVVRRLPPTVFWPRPKVYSAIVLIKPNPAKRAAISDLDRFHGFVHKLYLHRRKNLRGALLPHVADRFDKATLDAHLTRHGFDPQGRAEALKVERHLDLWRSFAEA